MLNVNAFVLLLCLELNSKRIDTAEINNFIVWPNDDIRTVAMSTENYGLAVACFKVYYGITKYTQYSISYADIYTRHIYQSFVIRQCLSNYRSIYSIRPETECSECVFASQSVNTQPQVSPTSRISHSLNPETSSLPVRTKVHQVWISFRHNAE